MIEIQPLLPDEKETEKLWTLYHTHPVLQSVLELKVQYEGLVDRAKRSAPVINGVEFTRRRKFIAEHYPVFPLNLDSADWLNQALFIHHGKDLATACLMGTIGEKHGQDALSFMGQYAAAAAPATNVDLQFYHHDAQPQVLPYSQPALSRRVVETIATIAKQLAANEE